VCEVGERKSVHVYTHKKEREMREREGERERETRTCSWKARVGVRSKERQTVRERAWSSLRWHGNRFSENLKII